MKIKIAIITIAAAMLTNCASNNNNTASSAIPEENSIPSVRMHGKNEMGKFRDEIFSRFIYSGAKISNNITATIYPASYYWTQLWVDDKNRPAKPFIQNLAGFRQKNMNQCQSLVDVVDLKLALLLPGSSLYKSIYGDTQTTLNKYKKLHFTGTAKYTVTNDQFNRIVNWQYAWNQPAICACDLGADVTQVCRKYGFNPLPLPKK